MPRTIISKYNENPESFGNYQKKKSRKKKKLRYKKIAFKITDAQQDALWDICKREKTTPVRFLKSVIKKQTARYKNNPQPVSYVTENQLRLFELDPAPVSANTKKKSAR